MWRALLNVTYYLLSLERNIHIKNCTELKVVFKLNTMGLENLNINKNVLFYGKVSLERSGTSQESDIVNRIFNIGVVTASVA